jgi:hypothetical protein
MAPAVQQAQQPRHLPYSLPCHTYRIMAVMQKYGTVGKLSAETNGIYISSPHKPFYVNFSRIKLLS